MSTSKNENPPSPMSDSTNSQDNPPVPESESSMDVDDADEPPRKRARTAPEIVSESFSQHPFTAGSSTTRPSPLTAQSFSFACSFTYARQLKFAIQGLCDPAITPRTLVRIDVDGNGFHITIQNSGQKDFRHLCLKPPDFMCSDPINGKIITLYELCRGLRNVDNDSRLYMFHVRGCMDLILYTFGIVPVPGITIMLQENNDEILKFPLRPRTCEAIPIPDDFQMMLQHLLQWYPYQVMVEIMGNTATLTTGQHEEPWTKDFHMSTALGRQVSEAGKRYRARFHWDYGEWLENVVRGDTALAVILYEEQPTYIVLRFFLENFGYLEYIREAVVPQ